MRSSWSGEKLLVVEKYEEEPAVSCEATVVTEAPAEDDEATTLKKKQHSQYVQMYKKFCANKEQISADHPHIISWFFKSLSFFYDLSL